MQYVSVGRRFVAILIDGVILLAAGFPFADFRHFTSASGVSTYRLEFHGAGAFGILVLSIVYYAVLEATLGATVGKMVMGIRVVQEDGSSCTWQGAIVRNLLRIIDALPFAYIVAAILVWTSPTRQRLGDRAGKTVVIRKGTETNTTPAATMNWQAPAPSGSVSIPPPPPPPPVGPPSPGSGSGDQPTP